MAELPKILDIPENLPFKQRVNILLVDDQPANLLALEAILEELDHNFVKARSGEDALQRLLGDEFAVVLLDVQMPGLDGFETARLIRGRKDAPATPIIFLTGHDNDHFSVEKAYSLGAVDYLVKPLVPVILRAKVAGFVELFQKTQQVKRQAERLRLMERREFEQKLAEENARLQQQREQLRVTLASIGDAVIAADAEGRVTFLNPVACSLTGWTPEEANGKPLPDVLKIVNEQTRQPVENPALRALTEGVIVGLANHTVLIAKDGTERPIEDSAAPIRDHAGDTVGVVLVFRDVTERRRNDEAHRENEARLRAIFEGSLDAILMTDNEGRYVEANPSACALFGMSREELLCHRIPDFAEPGFPFDVAWQTFRGTGHSQGEFRLVRPDGAVKDLEFAATADILPGRHLSILRDITDRKRAEVEARKNLEVLKLAQNAGRIGHWEWNALTDENKWSPEIEALYGLPPGGFEGGYQGWAKLVHPDDLARAEKDVRRALATGEYFTEFRVVWPDGSIHWLETRANVFKDAEGRAVRIIGVNMDITERKRAEEALRESEGRFRSLTESAPVGIFQTDAKGNCLFVNEKWCKLAGMLPEAAQGQGWVNALHPEDRERVFQEWYTAAQSGREFACEYRFRTPKGMVVWLQGSAVALRTEAGEVAGYIGTITDLTERREAEEQVRFQAHLLDSVGQAAVVTDPEGKIIYWNRYAETLYGWSRAEALGRNIVEVVVAPAAAGQAAEIMERLLSGERWSGEFLVRRRDGATFPAFVTDTPIFDGQGQLKAVIGISADITERKRVEQALRYLADASATLAAVVDYESTLQKVAGLAVPHFADWCAVDMVEADDSLRRLAVVHADSAKVKLAHEIQQRYPPDPDSPHGLPQVMRTGEPDMMTEIPDALLVQGARDEEHLRLLRELGLKSYMCVPLKGRGRLLGAVTFVSAESGRRYTPSDLAFAEELARRAAIAIENAQLYAELRQADRLKDEFLAMLAHELRNPLAPVRNALHIMKQPGANGAMLQQVRDMAERQVQHMARLLDDLLDVSRISRGRIELRKEAVDVAAVISRTVEAVRPLVEERRHELTVSLPAGPLRVEADSTRLEQVLTNLLNNAAKYTDSGGHVWLTAERDGREVVVRVRDTGIGIAPEMLPRIFDLFVQAERRLDRSQGGVGIGLTLVKKLVELHGGRIEATSAGLGRGSEFVVRLWALPDQHPSEKARAFGKDDVAELPRRRVMVVDDNQDAADSLAMLLRLAGQDVRAAYDGSSALTQAKDFQPAMVFLDIGMPGMDGYEVARRLRGVPGLRGVVLVALTGWGQEEDRRRSKEAGFDHHMVKPIEPAALENLLAGLRNQH